jgi:NAD(P)-dependent dehydrogenase (short-subunit alcohol dehydrogenase family)
MKLELAGRRAIVTGAAQGIGRAIVQALAAEGVQVAAFDIDAGGLP